MIRGERIELCAIERTDLARYVEWFNDPEVVFYFGRFAPMSIADEEEWYEVQRKDPTTRDFAIYFQGEHVGGAGFAHLDWNARSAEVGLVIGRKALWDQGLGADVMETLLRYGFEQLNLHRIYLRVFAEHTRAIRCYEKVGFSHEGRARDAAYRHGRYHDILWMGILENEYRERRRAGSSC